MKPVNRAMKDHPAYNRHTVYLFFFDQGMDAAVAGYMPLNGQFGYITGFTAAKQAEYYRTIAHEVAHGVFNLRHTFSTENRYVLSEGTTNNLLDYNGGTALYKYQWDLIHDPQKIWFAWMEEEGEGRMMGEPLFTFEWKAPPHSGMVTYITPSGLPISIENATQCFIATEDNAGFSLDNDGVFDDTPEGKIFSFYTDKGPLFGFEKDNKKWFAIFSHSYFYGYYNKESKEYYTETITENITASPYITYVWESSGWTAKNCCLKIADYESIKLQNTPDYKGAGYFETDAINRPEATCYVPKAIEQLTEASFSELYVGEAWAKYNHFGDGGILYKVILNNTTGYLYQNKDYTGNEYWLVYDKNAKHWKKFNYPGFRASDLLNIDFIGKIAQETGHNALDVIGVIPVIGEGADFINGVWYTVEGDALNASLCYASMIPVIGDAIFKGTKVVIKGIKSVGKATDIAKGLDKAINLTEQTSEVFVKIGKTLNVKFVANINECLYETGVLLTKHGDKAADLEKLLSALPTEKLHAVLTKLNSLEDGARVEFLTAIKYADDLPASHLAKNLDKIDEDILEAWSLLDGSPDIRLDIKNLENLKSVIKHPDYTFTSDQLLELSTTIKNSNSKSRLIEELNYATKYPDAFGNVDEIVSLAKRFTTNVRTLDYIPTSGTKLISKADKTVTIIGSWKDDMQYIKSKLQPSDFNVGTQYGDVTTNNYGFNILNIQDDLATQAGDKFFDLYNKPWLDKAIERGDDIILATKPIDKSLYINEVKGTLKGNYAKELDYLVKKDYKPINISDSEWQTIKSWFK